MVTKRVLCYYYEMKTKSQIIIENYVPAPKHVCTADL